MSKLISTLAAAAAILSAAPASAQGYPATQYDAMLAAALNQNSALSGQIGAAEDGVAASAMADPRIQAAYRQYLAAGGTQDFRTWAINYKWTNGYSPAGVQMAYGVQVANTAAEGAAWQELQMAQNASGAAIAGLNGGYADNQYQAGMQLGGWYYVTAADGTIVWYRR